MTVRSVDDLRAKIREVPDFPKPGILFYDITTLLRDGEAFREVIDRMAAAVKADQIDLVVGMGVDFWMELQGAEELDLARQQVGKAIQRIPKRTRMAQPRPAA